MKYISKTMCTHSKGANEQTLKIHKLTTWIPHGSKPKNTHTLTINDHILNSQFITHGFWVALYSVSYLAILRTKCRYFGNSVPKICTIKRDYKGPFKSSWLPNVRIWYNSLYKVTFMLWTGKRIPSPLTISYFLLASLISRLALLWQHRSGFIFGLSATTSKTTDNPMPKSVTDSNVWLRITRKVQLFTKKCAHSF